jgi:hypothetical protein
MKQNSAHSFKIPKGDFRKTPSSSFLLLPVNMEGEKEGEGEPTAGGEGPAGRRAWGRGPAVESTRARLPWPLPPVDEGRGALGQGKREGKGATSPGEERGGGGERGVVRGRRK